METAVPVDRRRVQRVRLLSAMYDHSNGDVYQTFDLVQAGKDAGIDLYDELIAAASYLDRNGLAELDSGGCTARITSAGIDVVEQSRSPIPDQEKTTVPHSTNLVVNAPVVGGIQFHSSNSTQTVSVALPKIEDSIKHLVDLVGRSSASELDKEAAAAALERLRSLAQKPKDAGVITKANEKIELVKNTIGTAVELGKIAAPYIAMLGSHFA